MYLPKQQSLRLLWDHEAALPSPQLEAKHGLLSGHSQAWVATPKQLICCIMLLQNPLTAFSPFPRTTYPAPFAGSLLPRFS